MCTVSQQPTKLPKNLERAEYLTHRDSKRTNNASVTCQYIMAGKRMYEGLLRVPYQLYEGIAHW